MIFWNLKNIISLGRVRSGVLNETSLFSIWLLIIIAILGLNTKLAALQSDGAIIIDEADLPKVEDITIGSYFYINNNHVIVSGISSNNDGLGVPYVVTTIERSRQLTGFNPNHVSAFLLKCTSQDLQAQRLVVEQINRTIPNVKAYLGEDFVNETKDYNKKTNGIL